MTRATIVGVALRAYPRDPYASYGEEMRSTLLETSADSRVRFALEVLSLVRQGFRARAAKTAELGAGRLIADGVRLGAVWITVANLVVFASLRIRDHHGPLDSTLSLSVLGTIVVVALIGKDRTAGLIGLAWTAIAYSLFHEHAARTVGVGSSALLFVCFLTTVMFPRRGVLNWRCLLWLVVPAGLVYAIGPGASAQAKAIVAGVLLLIGVTALVLFSTDPRLAIACALPCSYLGISLFSKQAIPLAVAPLLLATTPVAVCLAFVRNRRLQAPFQSTS